MHHSLPSILFLDGVAEAEVGQEVGREGKGREGVGLGWVGSMCIVLSILQPVARMVWFYVVSHRWEHGTMLAGGRAGGSDGLRRERIKPFKETALLFFPGWALYFMVVTVYSPTRAVFAF